MKTLYVVIAVLSWPCLTTLLYRHSRHGGSLLHKREDLGFSLAIATVASVIWPFGWFLVLCVTGFGLGTFGGKKA